MKKYLYLSGFLLSFNLACEKVIDVDVPFESPKLVLNGFLNPDSSFSVQVSKSQFVLDNAPLREITDARVTVYEGSTLLGELNHQGMGIYTLEGVKPEISKNYTIRAEKAGFPTVTASEIVLPLCKIEDIKVDSLGKDERGRGRWDIGFNIVDQAGKGNIYLIKVRESGYHKYYENYNPNEPSEPQVSWIHFSNYLEISTPDPLIEEMCTGYYYSCDLMLRDDLIDGKTYRVKLTSYGYWGGHDPQSVKDVKLEVIVYHVPESFYRYFSTLQTNRETSDNPFAEPAKVYSNIEGGFGIWSSLTAVSKAAPK